MGRVLYQDVVDAGGLEAVLREACPGGDIELKAFPGCLTATVNKGDRAVYVRLSRRRRRFYIRYDLRRSSLGHVATSDLVEFTGPAASWLGGATPRELVAAWPFADFVDAYESGDRTEFRWQVDRGSGRSAADGSR